jgi:hypothetical protein
MELLRHQARVIGIKASVIEATVKKIVLGRYGRYSIDKANELYPRVRSIFYRGLIGVYQEGEIESMTDIRDKRRDVFEACLQQTDWNDLIPEPNWHSWR